MSARNIVFRRVGQVHLAVLGEHSPTDEEWAAFVSDVTGSFGSITGVIVQTAGGRPSATQRRQVTEFWRAAEDPPRFALMTESRLIRGMVETLKVFLGDTVAAFAFDDFEGSAVHARQGGHEAAMLRDTASKLRGELQA